MNADERFATFYRQEYPRTVLYLLQNGASEADAKDAGQEAMAQAYVKWDEITFHGAWVRKAVYSCYLRQKEKRQREAPTAETLSPRRNDYADPADDHSQEEEFRIVALFRRLPEHQRQVAALFYDGLSQAEIAEAVNQSAATVRSNLRHARNRLREMIQWEGVDIGGDTS